MHFFQAAQKAILISMNLDSKLFTVQIETANTVPIGGHKSVNR